jgi:GNAT superfamily N-acetyltransferase
MGNLHIRRARPADLGLLAEEELGQRRFFADRLDRQAKGLGMLLTAWSAGRSVGVVYLWLEEAEEAEIRRHLPCTPILNHLEIQRDHRGQGIGAQLISGAERRLRMLGFRQVALAVDERHGRLARWYQELGYAEWPHPTVRCLPFGDGEVEICRVMVKSLLGEA